DVAGAPFRASDNNAWPGVRYRIELAADTKSEFQPGLSDGGAKSDSRRYSAGRCEISGRSKPHGCLVESERFGWCETGEFKAADGGRDPEVRAVQWFAFARARRSAPAVSIDDRGFPKRLARGNATNERNYSIDRAHFAQRDKNPDGRANRKPNRSDWWFNLERCRQ